jgi:hypothetical protein
VASQVRRQLGVDDADAPALSLARLTEIGRLRVNGVALDLIWSTDQEVTDGRDQPVLGVCEHDPEIPDTALISVNPHVVHGRQEVLLSTGAHELAHAIFEAPAWIVASRAAAEPGLFGHLPPSGNQQVFRTTTANEQHLGATYVRDASEFFQETRANEFMGALLVPRHPLTQCFLPGCQEIGIDPRTLISPTIQCQLAVNDDEPLEGPPVDSAIEDRGWLSLKLHVVATRLAARFGVTRRFIEVRLKRYGLIPQHLTLG